MPGKPVEAVHYHVGSAKPECNNPGWKWLRHAVYQCAGCNLYHDVRLGVFTTEPPPMYEPNTNTER